MENGGVFERDGAIVEVIVIFEDQGKPPARLIV
jgi:hypothetical protein